jgi:two-component system, NarL family, nitrate/nitrite response regulator NarL
MTATFSSVALVSANILFREGLARILSAARYKILLSADALDEAALAAITEEKPSAVLIHQDGGEKLNLSSIKLLKEHNPALGILIQTKHYDSEDALAAFAVGVNAYLVHISTCKAFLKTVELVILGETLLPAELLPRISGIIRETEKPPIPPDCLNATTSDGSVRQNAQCRLSPQEKHILQLLVEGSSNKLIARQVHAAESTVKTHVKTILRKINATNRTQAAVWAMNNKALFEQMLTSR